MNNEPIAWHYPGGAPDQCTTDKAYAEKDPAWTPMYYKPTWVGLTDEEIDKAWEWAQRSSPNGVTRITVFARAIERAHGIGVENE